MNQALRKALQVFWNTFGVVVVMVAACLVYTGMLWLGFSIAESIASTSGWRLIAFIIVMGIQAGFVVGVVRGWIAYRNEAKR